MPFNFLKNVKKKIMFLFHALNKSQFCWLVTLYITPSLCRQVFIKGLKKKKKKVLVKLSSDSLPRQFFKSLLQNTIDRYAFQYTYASYSYKMYKSYSYKHMFSSLVNQSWLPPVRESTLAAWYWIHAFGASMESNKRQIFVTAWLKLGHSFTKQF